MTTVQDIINENPNRLADRKRLYPLINKAIRLVGQRLVALQSDIISTEFSLSFLADEQSKALPTDFWGMHQPPYDTTKSYHLVPLPNHQTEVQLALSGSSDPMYYKVRGTTLYVYATPGSATTFKGYYYQRPTTLTKPTDTLPWNGIFDNVIVEMFYYSIDNKTGDPSLLLMVDQLAGIYTRSAEPDIDIDF